MALDTERSEQHQLSNGFAGLKGFANDIWAAADAGTRRWRTHLPQPRRHHQIDGLGGEERRRRGALGGRMHSERRSPHRRRHCPRRAIGSRSRRAGGAQAPKALAPLQAWFSRQRHRALLLRQPPAPHPHLQPHRLRHPGRRHPLSRLVPHLADRRQARRPQDARARSSPTPSPPTPRSCASASSSTPMQAARGSRSAPTSFRDDGFASLELSIHPEDVTPILRKLIQPTNTRARIYARDGTLIVDTAQTLAQVDGYAQRADDRQRRRVAGNAEHLDPPDALFLQGAAARLPGDRRRQRHGLPGGARRARRRGQAACCCSTARASRSSRSPCRSAASTTCRACCCCRRAPARSTRSSGRSASSSSCSRRSPCSPRSSPRCCWRAPSPAPCAVCRPPPSTSATTSTRARSCRSIPAAPTRWRRWPPPSTR